VCWAQEAAALPFAALTAWRALEGAAGLREARRGRHTPRARVAAFAPTHTPSHACVRSQQGESLLVLGAGGAVGLAAVQLARAWGAGRVCATARARSAARVAAAGGGDESAVADADAPLASEAQRLGWPQFDVVLDTGAFPRSLALPKHTRTQAMR
jgi:NADPH:quinone reductase-like Zn-dependent oxidoreductase